MVEPNLTRGGSRCYRGATTTTAGGLEGSPHPVSHNHYYQQKGTMNLPGYNECDLTSPACAHRGAQWLDKVRPTWPLLITQPIKLLTFDQCVLGQVFAVEADGGEGYLYAKLRYEHEWNELMPWWMTRPESSYYRSTAGIYLGYKGNVGCEIAWAKEIGIRKPALLQKELGL